MQEIVSEINKHKKFIITAHINLEGDSLGSQLAMKELIKGLGKEALIVDSDAVPGQYKFLPNTGEISNKIDKKIDFDAILVLDCPNLKRIGKVNELLSKDKAIINIDHHISNEKFGAVNWVDPSASSAGEMVYKLFGAMNVRLTKEAALSLYIAILTDTGSFNYENTSGVTHKIAGELLGYGLDPASVSESIYDRRSVSDIKFLALVLSTIRVNNEGDVAYLEITKDMLKKTGSNISTSEGFVNYARSIDKVKVAIIFKEDLLMPGKISVSFRSKGGVDVNKIASNFGGGGHPKASGCVIESSLEEAEKKVLVKVEEVLRGRNTVSR